MARGRKPANAENETKTTTVENVEDITKVLESATGIVESTDENTEFVEAHIQDVNPDETIDNNEGDGVPQGDETPDDTDDTSSDDDLKPSNDEIREILESEEENEIPQEVVKIATKGFSTEDPNSNPVVVQKLF